MSDLPAGTLATIKAVAAEHFAPIPWTKRVGKALFTVAGFAIFVGAFLLPRYLGFPWQASLAVAGFGGWMMSKEMTTSFLGFIPKVIAAVVRALGGKNGNGATSG